MKTKSIILVFGFIFSALHIKSLLAQTLIATVSDGDMYAQSYLGKPLPDLEKTQFSDQLNFFYLEKGVIKSSQIFASNSVAGTPEIFEISPKKDFAVVVETIKTQQKGDRVFKDLKKGNTLTLVDIRDLQNPKVTQKIELDFQPLSVDISADGQWVAVGGQQGNQGYLAFAKVYSFKFEKIYQNPVINILKLKDNFKNSSISLVQWHPKQNSLAIHFFRENKIVFAHWNQDSLKLWGNPVLAGPDPFVGRFSADGTYYLTANWNRNFEAQSIYERLPDSSTLSAIKVGQKSHQLVQTVSVPSSPEGIAISKTKNLLAIVCMEKSLYSIEKTEYKNKSSVHLYAIEPHSKNPLKLLSSQNFAALLPEGLSFDESSQNLFITSFQDRARDSQFGELHQFSIHLNESLILQFEKSFEMPHGLHHVVVK